MLLCALILNVFYREIHMAQTKFIFVILFFLSLTACGGGGADIQTTTHNTTMGQELMDLDESYKKGILTEKEYKRAKENIMDRYDQ